MEGRAQAAAFAIPIVNKINNSVIKEVYAHEVSNLCGMDIKTMDAPPSSLKRQETSNAIKASSNTPIRVKAVINIFSSILAFPSIAKEKLFDELKVDPNFNFLFLILDLYKQTPDIKPSRVIENIEEVWAGFGMIWLLLAVTRIFRIGLHIMSGVGAKNMMIVW